MNFTNQTSVSNSIFLINSCYLTFQSLHTNSFDFDLLFIHSTILKIKIYFLTSRTTLYTNKEKIIGILYYIGYIRVIQEHTRVKELFLLCN